MPSDPIRDFLAGDFFAVVGASTDRAKYGNKVLRAYQQAGRRVAPVNPNSGPIEGLVSHASLSVLPEKPHGVSIVTQPAVTRAIVDEAIALGIRHIWMQPGAEDASAVEKARAAGVSVIAGGPCALVELHFRERG